MCVNYVYDEDTESYDCMAEMDEDDYVRTLESKSRECPFFRLDDEYGVVRHQN